MAEMGALGSCHSKYCWVKLLLGLFADCVHLVMGLKLETGHPKGSVRRFHDNILKARVFTKILSIKMKIKM